MPETKAQRSAAARKGAATRKRHEAEGKKQQQAGAIDRTAELSTEMFKSLESGQRAAVEAVRKFIDTVDEALPALGERPSRRKEVVDAAMEMTDRLIHTQYDFLRHVVKSAGEAVSSQDARK